MKKLINIFLLSLITFVACTTDDVDWSDEAIYNTYALSITTPTAADLYDTEIVLRGSVTEGNEFDTAGFYVSLEPFSSATGGIRGEAESISAEGTFSYHLEGIVADTTYMVRPFGVKDGNQTLGATIQFKTYATLDTDAGVAYSSTVITPGVTTATIAVQIDEETGVTNDLVKEYGYRYWQKDGDGSQYEEVSYSQGDGAYSYSTDSGFAILLSGLNVNGSYTGQFFARTRPENTEYFDSSEENFDLVEVSDPVLGATSAIVGGTFVILTTQVTSVANDPLIECGYKINGVEYPFTHSSGLSDGGSFSVTISDLANSTTFSNIEVYARSSALPDDYYAKTNTSYDKSVTTTDESDVAVNLSDLSTSSYPTSIDTWCVLTEEYPTADDLTSLKNILAALCSSGREITLRLPNIVSFPEKGLYELKYTEYAMFNVILENALFIEASAFQSTTSLKSAVVGPWTSIETVAFHSCSNLESMIALDEEEGESCPEGHEVYIGGSGAAFNVATSLTKVYLPNTTYITTNAFFGCSALEELRLPKLVQHRNTRLMNGCSSLKVFEVASAPGVRLDGFATAAAGFNSSGSNYILVTNYGDSTDDVNGNGSTLSGVTLNDVYQYDANTGGASTSSTVNGTYFTAVYKSWEEYEESLK